MQPRCRMFPVCVMPPALQLVWLPDGQMVPMECSGWLVRYVVMQVRREVREEAGVEVGPVHILGSQPWPVGEAQQVCVPLPAWALLCMLP